MNDDVVLVTGANGLIGRAVIRRLVSAGRQVVGADVVCSGEEGVPFVLQELTDRHRWHEIINRFYVTKVVHAGGVSGPMLMQDQPARICEINLMGLASLLEAARIHSLGRIIWFSSIAAYGNRPDLSPVDEKVPLQPATIYAATKAAGEALLTAYHAEHGVDSVALRVASCFGPGRTSSCFIRIMIEDALKGRATAVRDSSTESRQHIFVDDVVDGVIAALNASSLRQRVYNIGPGRMQTLNEIVSEVRTVLPNIDIEIRPDGLGWNMFGVGPLKIDAARRDLGFEPRTTLAMGAIQTRDWIESRRGGL
jgi:nucleoside-diphosphate-sugar epimerase